MNYPVWQLDFFGGGLLIALMAVLHVFISHFAIGGGLFLVLTEMKAYRENSPAILEYTRKHTRFFLLLTLVLGAMTGVGIWFTIALIAPHATSILIHNFVFAWAIEWVFFAAEIIAILIYYHTFGRMERRNHLIIGWLYFVFAWLSLFVINGIIGFMLTPGQWLATGNFWDGFFNPSFWPALFFRTFLCLMLAGLYGFLTSTAIKDRDLRLRMVRYCALWLLAPFLLFLASAYWYVQALPEATRIWIIGRSPDLAPFVRAFLLISPVLFLGGLIMSIRLPQAAGRALAVVLLLIGITYLGSFEYIREGSRRPYTLYGHIYSNAILGKDLAAVRERGILASARWVRGEIDGKNQMAMGRRLFTLMCSSCHSLGGPVRDIRKLSAGYRTVPAMAASISGHGRLLPAMPPFPGTDQEREALAAYIIRDLQGKKELPAPAELTAAPLEDLPFSPESSPYLLLAWSSTGMREISDADSWFSFRPPGNGILAQLIRRGPLPEVVTEGVVLRYRVEAGFENPAATVDYWKHSGGLAANTGTSGNTPAGLMMPMPGGKAFLAEEVPLTPYGTDGNYLPYPVVTIEARDSASNELLAATRVVAPVATEWGCNNCHGGGWRKEIAGISPVTARNILTAHDRLNRTGLLAAARAGNPVRCQSCHPDPASDAAGDPALLNLSAAIHGWHANFLGERGADACAFCHAAGPQGVTRQKRGVHHTVGLDCTNCHGFLEDHALSLLLGEKEAGKAGAARLMKHLQPRLASDVTRIRARTPWLNEPDCLACHTDFGPPTTDNAFNAWSRDGSALYRNQRDESGSLHCAACHGSPHAIYPAVNPYEARRDSFLPLQLQQNPYPVGANGNCKVCHTVDMTDEMHHANSLGMMRNLLPD